MKYGRKKVNPWDVKVKKLAPSSGFNKSQVQQLFKEALEKGKGESIGWRRVFHPSKKIKALSGSKEGRVSFKGGFLIGEENKVSVQWKKEVETRVKKGMNLDKAGYVSGAEGFVDKHHSSKEYSLGRKLFRKCPEVMANVPFALIEFKNIKAEGRFFPEKQRSIMQSVPENSRRVVELNETLFSRGNYKEAFKIVIDSLVEMSPEKNKERYLRIKQKASSEKAVESSPVWIKLLSDVMPDYRVNAVTEAKKNLWTVYEKTKHIPDGGYGAKDIETRGKLADFADFERTFSDKKAIERISQVMDEFERNLRSFERKVKKHS